MNKQPAGKKKSVKMLRAGFYLKPSLIEIAHAAVKDKDHSAFPDFYQIFQFLG